MFLSIDRIEEDFAVCIDDFGDVCAVEIAKIQGEAYEGAVLAEENGGYILCPEEEEKRRKENFNLAESLFD